jgi:hypothetical protein
LLFSLYTSFLQKTMALIAMAVAGSIMAVSGLANNVINTFFGGGSTQVNYILTSLTLLGAIVAGVFLYKSKSNSTRMLTILAGVGVMIPVYLPNRDFRAIQSIAGGMLIGYGMAATKDPDWDPELC